MTWLARAAARRVLFGVLAGVALMPARAGAAEVTRVLTGFDESHRLDFNVTVSWLHSQKQASIKRESAAAASQTQLLNDLVYHQTRDILNTRVEMGVFRDLGLHVDLPYVLRDDRELDFDQPNGQSCADPSLPSTGTCVDQNNSTLLRDGILPGAGKATYGVDATSGGMPFSAPTATVFKAPRRSGLESLGFGISWAAMNQAREENSPTWLLTLDTKFDVGTTMRYDAARPDANSGVGLGFHQLIASTFVSKRLGAMDPYFGAYYMLPWTSSSSPFAKLPVGSQPYAAPPSRAGLQFGFEYVAWEQPDIHQRITLETRMRGEHRFQGSGHSELWEPLSGSSACRAGNASACRQGIDLDLDGDGVPDRAHPGVTEIQAYSTIGGDVALNVQAGRSVRFRGVFGLSADLSHFITFATAGSDKDGDGRVDSTNRAEANPAYRESIDLPGRRFKVDGSQSWNLSVDMTAVF